MLSRPTSSDRMKMMLGWVAALSGLAEVSVARQRERINGCMAVGWDSWVIAQQIRVVRGKKMQAEIRGPDVSSGSDQ